MCKIFGDFITEIPEQTGYLQIGFSPGSLPLKQRWQTNGLSADFISEYLEVFFVGQRLSQGEIKISSATHEAVKYIANELLENAMKFSAPDAPSPTRISFFLLDNQVVFQVANITTSEFADNLEVLINILLNHDPQELYVAKMEANAEEVSDNSGLGFLSMICDYSAKLSWKFEPLASNPSLIVVATMVKLDII
jgi:hypothetical protein